MLLTLTTTLHPATDLGFLLHKNSARVQSFSLTFGRAHVFYPETSESRCTAALMVEVDPVALVRRKDGDSRTLEEYVNDRPYVASSFMSVAIGDVFSTAMSGKCRDRPELALRTLPLEATINLVSCGGGEDFLHRLFEPLGYEVQATPHVLDEANPGWGMSRYFTVAVRGEKRLSDLLAHLYVLIPVLDDHKHYFVGEDEVRKLLRRGEGWLISHPDREAIIDRYLKHQKSLTRRTLEQLTVEETPEIDEVEAEHNAEEVVLEKRISLNEHRLGSAIAAIKASGAQRVLDLGCGDGNLLRELIKEKSITQIVGVDVSHRALEIASRRLHMDRMSEQQRARISLLHGSLTYRDARLAGFDAAAALEVVEHLDPARLNAFERCLFECARPQTVVLTTPNVEYNVRFEKLPADKFRHRDHRFEWTRAEFQTWAKSIGERFGYNIRFLAVGNEDGVIGPPTQMGVFTRTA